MSETIYINFQASTPGMGVVLLRQAIAQLLESEGFKIRQPSERDTACGRNYIVIEGESQEIGNKIWKFSVSPTTPAQRLAYEEALKKWTENTLRLARARADVEAALYSLSQDDPLRGSVESEVAEAELESETQVHPTDHPGLQGEELK